MTMGMGSKETKYARPFLTHFQIPKNTCISIKSLSCAREERLYAPIGLTCFLFLNFKINSGIRKRFKTSLAGGATTVLAWATELLPTNKRTRSWNNGNSLKPRNPNSPLKAGNPSIWFWPSQKGIRRISNLGNLAYGNL